MVRFCKGLFAPFIRPLKLDSCMNLPVSMFFLCLTYHLSVKKLSLNYCRRHEGHCFSGLCVDSKLGIHRIVAQENWQA